MPLVVGLGAAPAAPNIHEKQPSAHVPSHAPYRARARSWPPWSAPSSRRSRLGQDDDHDERLDLGRPARRAARKTYVKQHPGNVKFKLAQGGSDVGIADVAARPRDDRQLLARPEAQRPGRPRLQQDRPRRDLRRHQPGEPVANLTQAQVQAIFSGAGRATGARSRAPAQRARSTSSSAPRPPVPQDAFQKIFMGTDAQVARARPQKASNGLVQQAVQSDHERDRLRLARLHQGDERRSPTRASPAPCATPSPASTAACATSGWSPAARRRARAKTFINWVQTAARPRSRSSAQHWVPLQVDAAAPARTHGAVDRTGAPS